MARYPWPEFVLFHILRTLIFYPTRRNAYRAVIFAAMVFTAARIYLTPLDVPSAMGAIIAFSFAYTTYILYVQGSFPDHWRRVRDEDRDKTNPDGSANMPSNFPFMKKLGWMLSLTFNARLVGWLQEPRDHLPPRPQSSRRAFLWNTLLKLIINATLLDITTLVSPQGSTIDFTDGPEAYLATVPFLHRVPYVLAWGIRARNMVSFPHNIAALVCVGLGGSSPTLWPDMWGRWRDAYTVRNLWGKTWHQQMRPMLSGFGRLVANRIFGFPRGTNRSSYTQLYVAFVLSGLIHCAGDCAFEKRIVYRSLKYFFLHAVAITVEDFVIYIATRLLLVLGVKLKPGRADESRTETVVRVVGYCWVTLWLCFAIPIVGVKTSTTSRGRIVQYWLDTWIHGNGGGNVSYMKGVLGEYVRGASERPY